MTALIFATQVSVATAQQTPSLSQVRGMLSAFEGMPTQAQWRALGPGTLRQLVRLYSDRSEPSYVRFRTLDAAQHFPTRATRTFLLGVAQTPGQSDLYIRQAILSLGRAFGESAVEHIAPFSDDAHASVREGVVMALSEIGTPPAIAILRDRATLERAQHIRERIVSGLQETSSDTSSSDTSSTQQ